MSFPYFRWFPGDYAKDTAHLTLLQHGAYRELIDAYMGAGKPIRGDLNTLCRICGALSGEERNAVELVLGEFFLQDGPLWRNARCDRELEYLKTLSTAGQKAAQARWRDGSAFAMRPHSDGNASQSHSHIQKNLKQSQERVVSLRATRLAKDWEIPQKLKEWTCNVYHLTPQAVVVIALDFRDYWVALPGAKGCKLDWDATWRRWIKKETENARLHSVR